jgi:hypothetical protein
LLDRSSLAIEQYNVAHSGDGLVALVEKLQHRTACDPAKVAIAIEVAWGALVETPADLFDIVGDHFKQKMLFSCSRRPLTRPSTAGVPQKECLPRKSKVAPKKAPIGLFPRADIRKMRARWVAFNPWVQRAHSIDLTHYTHRNREQTIEDCDMSRITEPTGSDGDRSPSLMVHLQSTRTGCARRTTSEGRPRLITANSSCTPQVSLRYTVWI